MGHKIIYLFSILFLLSCGGEDLQTVEEYIAANNLTTKELSRGVHIVIEDEGAPTKAKITDNITVNYKGYLTDGSVFDQNNNITFPLNGVILGWQIGFQELGEGGKATLIIPASAGYGSRGSGSIPGNATLIFDVELLDIR